MGVRRATKLSIRGAICIPPLLLTSTFAGHVNPFSAL